MIKEFYKISEKDLNYLLTHKFSVWEKLDMCYFRVEITKIGAIALKGSTGKVISDIDCVTNSLYKEICEFVNNNINPVRNEIIEKYGEACLGFFFLPGKKYHKIYYPYLKENSAVLSDWSYNFDITDTDDYIEIIKLCDTLQVHRPPIISTWNKITMINIQTNFSELANEYLKTKDEHCLKSIIEILMGGKDEKNAASGNYIENIEGLIIRTDKFQYQIKIQDTEDNIDKTTKLIYRDTLLKSVADFYENNENTLIDAIEKADSYIDRVSKLFLLYLESTDLFTKISFDPEDLLPPTTAYFGDIDFDMISDSNVKLICKYNEVNKNIFRLFLHTFSQKISEDKFSSLSDKTKHYLNDLIIKLKYKNYKEILLTAYKANN